MTTYGIRTIAEQSMAAWFATNASMLPGVQINIGQTGEIRTIPSVILYCESADAHPNFGGIPVGNFELTLKIYVYSSADDAPTELEALNLHRSRVENVQAIMQDLPGLKAAWTQGKLYHAWLRSDEEGVADRRYGNVLTYAAATVFPPA
jgi:hypothetical protein